MTPSKYDPCRRGCCWTPFACGKQRQCPCHSPTLAEWLGTPAPDNVTPIRRKDPTGNKAVANIMRERKRRRE